MKIGLRANLFIDPTETALIDQIRDFLIANKAKFLKIDGDETSSIIVEKHYHDEIPPKLCETIFEWKRT